MIQRPSFFRSGDRRRAGLSLLNRMHRADQDALGRLAASDPDAATLHAQDLLAHYRGASLGDLPGDRRAQLSAGRRGAVDNSALTERGVIGLFMLALADAMESSWVGPAAMEVPADSPLMKHRFLGQVPPLRKAVGGLLAKGLNDFSINIEGIDFDVVVKISKHDWLRDKTGQLDAKIGELGQRFVSHWKSLLVTDVLSNPATALAYDGVVFYSTAHQVGDSATMDNALVAGTLPALNIGDPDVATKDEALSIMTGLVSQFWTFQDDQGEPWNQDAKGFQFVVPVKHWPGFFAAVRDSLRREGGTNPTINLGLDLGVAVEPRLGTTTEIHAFRTDAAGSKSLLIQEDDALGPEVRMLGPESDHYAKENEILIIGKATRNVSPGDFRQAVRGITS